MYNPGEEMKKETIAKLIDAVCKEQRLFKETNGNVLKLIDKTGSTVFEYNSEQAFTVTSFLKQFSDALKENLI